MSASGGAVGKGYATAAPSRSASVAVPVMPAVPSGRVRQLPRSASAGVPSPPCITKLYCSNSPGTSMYPALSALAMHAHLASDGSVSQNARQAANMASMGAHVLSSIDSTAYPRLVHAAVSAARPAGVAPPAASTSLPSTRTSASSSGVSCGACGVGWGWEVNGGSCALATDVTVANAPTALGTRPSRSPPHAATCHPAAQAQGRHPGVYAALAPACSRRLPRERRHRQQQRRRPSHT